MLVSNQCCSTQHATMARWGDEKTLHFICLYRQRECLWNTRSPLYKNKVARDNAYQSILQEFNDKHLDIKSVKTKIKNLRSVYHTELKKVKNTRRCGSVGSVYKPSLSWFDEMHDFLGDIFEDRHDSTVYIEIDTPRSDNVDSGRDADTGLIIAKAAYDTDPLQETQASATAAIDDKPCTVSASSSRHQAIKRKPFKRSRPYGDNPIVNAIQRLENRVCNAAQQGIRTATEDEFHLFALSVAAQLRQLPLHIAIATQSKIQNTLSEARIGSLFSITLSPSMVSVKTEDTGNADI